jgi:hypothetical protein
VNNVGMKTIYVIECYRDGLLIWTEGFNNRVVTEGLNKILDATFKTGFTAPTWYVGLVDGAAAPSFQATDVMTAHGGWTEKTNYSNATRPGWTPGTVSGGSVDNSAAKAAFSINASGTIAGAFLVTDNSKGGTGGTLYGEGSFAGGNRSVVSGDTLNVTVTLTAITG